MARRSGQRKKRTHLKGSAAAAATTTTGDGAPKSFVIKHGQVGSSLAQLVRDFRKVMEPNTASRLRERSRNKLKDYLTLAPALHVTHLLAFTLTPIAPYMRIVRLSAGPTLTFRVERYSLLKDVLSSSRRARSIGLEYLSPPLLVLASFPPPAPTTPPHLPLLMKSFQTLFPPLSPKTLTLSAARRVVLVSYNPERGTVDFRHYLITVKPYGVSKRVRRILEGGGGGGGGGSFASFSRSSGGGILDLGNEKDVADFLLRGRGEDGYESAASSASATESVAGDDAVSLADDYVGRNNKKGQKKAVRLDEIGPRLELRLVKITEGVPGKEGNVIFHEFVKKSKKEVNALNAAHAAKEKLRRERREEQERNVERKRAQKNDGDEGEEGEWDDEEEISEGEDSDEGEESDDDVEEEEEEPRDSKKVKRQRKR